MFSRLLNLVVFSLTATIFGAFVASAQSRAFLDASPGDKFKLMENAVSRNYTRALENTARSHVEKFTRERDNLKKVFDDLKASAATGRRVSKLELDKAKAELDVAQVQIETAKYEIDHALINTALLDHRKDFLLTSELDIAKVTELYRKLGSVQCKIHEMHVRVYALREEYNRKYLVDIKSQFDKHAPNVSLRDVLIADTLQNAQAVNMRWEQNNLDFCDEVIP